MLRRDCLALFLLALVLPVWAEPLPDPEALGPHPVGVTTIELVDYARHDGYTDGPRTLMTEIWYPATEETRGLPKNRLLDFFGGGRAKALGAMLKLAFDVDLAEVDARFPCEAVRDARVRGGVYPLVLFSHGNGGLRMQNSFWCEHIASHGYLVAAPDHTGNCAVTLLNGKPVPYNKNGRDAAAEARPKDISFLIDCFERMNKGADSRFLGKVDLEHIAVGGHSFGGYTCSWVAESDPRVDAIVPMTGIAKVEQTYAGPLLAFVATEDDTIGLEGNARIREYYAKARGPRMLIEFPDAGHFSFTEMGRFAPDFGDGIGTGTRITNGEPITYVPPDLVHRVTNGYSAAFLGLHLKGLEAYIAYLDRNHAPEAITHERAPARPTP